MQVRDYSDGFRANWFVEQFETGRESPDLDFKVRLYKFDDDDNKFEFARDVIAFANIAWRTNRKCYILFGVGKDEQGQRTWNDVRNQFPGRNMPSRWDNPNVSVHDKQVDGVQQVFYDVAPHWIDPEVPDLALQYGEVNGVFVSYLEIKPTPSSRPFSLKRPYVRKKDGKQFNKGDVFVRKGAATARLADSEVPSLYQWNQVAYLGRSEWQQIIQAHLSGVFEEMQNLSPYFQPKTDKPDITAFDAAMQALDAGKRLVVIAGHAGSGKTVLLHRLAFAVANRHNLALPTQREFFGQSEEGSDDDQVIANVANELEVVPPFPIPIFMTLRGAFESTAVFEKQLLAKLQEWTGKGRTENICQFFNIPGSKWVILLDGVDEIRNRDTFAPLLHTWVNNLPKNVQVVVTSRPAYAESESSSIAKVEIKSLSPEDTLYLLMGSLPQDAEWEDKRQDIKNWLSQHPDLFELLTSPRALAGFVKQLTSITPSGRTPMDQDHVETVETYVPHPSLVGNDDAPSLTVEPNVVQEDLPPGEDSDSPDEQSPLLPRLAISVRAIAIFMREEEIKRRGDWGQTARRNAERAQIELDETAWRSEWSADSFDSQECERNGWITPESCNWNEDIGFIRYKYPRRYQFMCNLLHHYLCAEYAWDFELKEEEIRETMIQRNTSHPVTQSVLNLLNQIRLENGRQPIHPT